MIMFEYLIAFNFRGGNGRAYMTLSTKLDSIEKCMQTEAMITQSFELPTEAQISWFKLLREVPDPTLN
jgi:hypothetical protein